MHGFTLPQRKRGTSPTSLWTEVYDRSSKARKPRQVKRDEEKKTFCPDPTLTTSDSVNRVGINGNVSTVWSGGLNAYSAALAVLWKKYGTGKATTSEPG
ncbi:hypothetical protein PspLS_03732 [Pyricularia sp. CBS 133598]|nr:hypothetical protein PspLS_03732 [Pyricularia sp. CBS 133598]